MSLFADFRRRFELRPSFLNLAGSLARGRPEASSVEQPCGRREPHGKAGIDRSAYLAIAEALQDGTDVVPASDEVGRRLAEDGVSLLQALDGLSALYRSIAGGEPAFDAVRALSSSWAEASLIYLHSLSCEDPLTGLSSLAHLRSRLGEIYREAELHGTSVPATYALVVVEPIHQQGLPSVERELRLIDVAECLRIVFCGGDVLGRIGPRRAAALIGRNPNLPDEVETVRSLITRWRLDSEEPQLVRVWIEGLPASVEWAGRVLDELAR
jgi:GGDEF domain-containing protein